MMRSAPTTLRGVSMSSMRTSQRPPWARASSQLASAATSEPACSGPVGEGAKRPVGPRDEEELKGGTATSQGNRVYKGLSLRHG
jgi:hypothetical protein